MARVVVAGAGAIGASIAYHLALRGADGVVLAEVGEIAGGATGKAMGGVRQQFTTEAEVRLAQASVRLFRELGAALRAGRLPLPRDLRGGARRAGGATRASRPPSASRSRGVDPSFVSGLRVDDVLGATICREDGIADPGGRDARAGSASCAPGRRRASSEPTRSSSTLTSSSSRAAPAHRRGSRTRG